MKQISTTIRLVLTVALAYMASKTLHAQIPSSGLIAYYPFNNKMIDASSNGNDALLGINLEPAEDRFGNGDGAYRFNGKSSYISVPNSKTLQAPQRSFAICVWFKLEAKSGSYDVNLPLVNKGGAAEGKTQYGLNLQRVFGDSYSTVSISSDFNGKDPAYLQHSIDFDKWYFLAATTEDEWIYVYLNGKLIWQGINAKGFISNESNLEIGRNPATGKYFSGCLDDLRIYRTGLSATEVQQLYKDESDKNFFDEVDVKPAPQTQTYSKAVAIPERDTKQPTKAIAIQEPTLVKPNASSDLASAEEKELAVQKMNAARIQGEQKRTDEILASQKQEDERRLVLQKEEEHRLAIQKEEEQKLTIKKMEEARQLALRKEAEQNLALQKQEEQQRLVLQKEEERKLEIIKMEEAKRIALQRETEQKLAIQKQEEERRLALQKEQERKVAIQKIEEEQKLALQRLEEEQKRALRKLEQDRQLALKKLEDERQLALKKITEDSPPVEPTKGAQIKQPLKETTATIVSAEDKALAEERKIFLQKMEEARRQFEAEQKARALKTEPIKEEVVKQEAPKTTSVPSVQPEKKSVSKAEEARLKFDAQQATKIEMPIEKPVASSVVRKPKPAFDKKVLLSDKKPPVFKCPKDTTIYLPRNRRGIVYYYTPPDATDNVGVDSIWQTLGSKSGCFLQLGVHPFTFYAVDYSGNQNFCTHSIIIKENPEVESVTAPTQLNEVLELGDDTIHYEHKATVKDCRITVYIYDDGEEDNDTVSIIFNGEVIVSHAKIKLKENGAIKRELNLIPGTENYLVAKAWNTGRYGLNTLRIDAYEGVIANDKKDLKGLKAATSKVLHSKPGTAGGMLLKCD